jgi:mRNA interferase HigB
MKIVAMPHGSIQDSGINFSLHYYYNGLTKAQTTTMVAVRPCHFTVSEYHRMSEFGILPPDERTELLNGQIITMAAKGTAHHSAISAGKLKEASAVHSGVNEVIKNFYKKVEKSTWQNLIDVQQDYRDAEAVGSFTVFNIKGNRYRLILDIDYEEQVAYFKYFLTHAEYDKEQWKDDPYY